MVEGNGLHIVDVLKPCDKSPTMHAVTASPASPVEHMYCASMHLKSAVSKSCSPTQQNVVPYHSSSQHSNMPPNTNSAQRMPCVPRMCPTQQDFLLGTLSPDGKTGSSTRAWLKEFL
uniref:Uncharacterized protein n=1 Tax=Eutreptiella gymnastica TaxID=73025 RepID=A0A7S4G630_9EUGL